MLTSLTPTKCKPLSSLTAREWMLTTYLKIKSQILSATRKLMSCF